mmetsp:Transcript_109391/g.316206  ORF Transcript_109391/g.316206 Transcript_109391/m.316206 type:complete len:253 (+) Transcript_109391:567-1325(+)
MPCQHPDHRPGFRQGELRAQRHLQTYRLAPRPCGLPKGRREACHPLLGARGPVAVGFGGSEGRRCLQRLRRCPRELAPWHRRSRVACLGQRPKQARLGLDAPEHRRARRRRACRPGAAEGECVDERHLLPRRTLLRSTGLHEGGQQRPRHPLLAEGGQVVDRPRWLARHRPLQCLCRGDSWTGASRGSQLGVARLGDEPGQTLDRPSRADIRGAPLGDDQRPGPLQGECGREWQVPLDRRCGGQARLQEGGL